MNIFLRVGVGLLALAGISFFTWKYLHQQPDESLISSHEGKILKGLVVFNTVEPGQSDCDNIIVNQLGASDSLYIEDLSANFEICVVHNLFLSFSISDSFPNLSYYQKKNVTNSYIGISDTLDALSKKVEVHRKRYLRHRVSLANPIIDTLDSWRFESILLHNRNDANTKSLATIGLDTGTTSLDSLTLSLQNWRNSVKSYFSYLYTTILSKHKKDKVIVFPEFIDDYCSYASTRCNCLLQIQDLLNSNVQDQLFVQVPVKNEVLRSRSNPKLIKDGDNNGLERQKNLIIQLGLRSGTVVEETPSSLDFPGGNVHSNSRYAFIGMDELKKFSSNWYDGLGETRQFVLFNDSSRLRSENEIKAKIERKIGKKVCWLGRDTLRRLYRREVTSRLDHSFQPVFHIDLFFSPLKWKIGANGGKDTLVYILAVPSEFTMIYKGPEEKKEIAVDRVKEIRATVIEMNNVINKFLLADSVIGKAIEIPFPIKFDGNMGGNDAPLIESYFSFANGVVDDSAGRTRYFIPYYNILNTHLSLKRCYINAATAISQYADTIPIRGKYGATSGLHCKFVAIDRE